MEGRGHYAPYKIHAQKIKIIILKIYEIFSFQIKMDKH